MFGVRMPDETFLNLVPELASRNIFISQRGSALRFAPHLHINDNDIDRLLETVREVAG